MNNRFSVLQNIFRVLLQAEETTIDKIHDFLIKEKILIPIPAHQLPTEAPASPVSTTPIVTTATQTISQ